MLRLTDVIKNLLIINVLVFIAVQTLPDVLSSYGDLANLYNFQSDKFYPFQIVTSMFMHADFGHLFMNMLGLFFLGPMVEDTLGGKRFFTLYILAGLVGTIAQICIHYFGYVSFVSNYDSETLSTLMNEGQEILKGGRNYTDPVMGELNVKLYRLINYGVAGASGCVYGVIVAFATMFPNMKLKMLFLPIEIPGFLIGIVPVGLAIYYGITGNSPGIGHFAHLGGAITGFILVHYWKMANLR